MYTGDPPLLQITARQDGGKLAGVLRDAIVHEAAIRSAMAKGW